MAPVTTPRGAAVAQLLTGLDALVRREVTRPDAGVGRWEDDADRIADEVAATLGRLQQELDAHPRTAPPVVR